MEKNIVKINRHTAQTISNLSYEEWQKEQEVCKLRREAFDNNKDFILFNGPHYVFKSESYLYVWVR